MGDSEAAEGEIQQYLSESNGEGSEHEAAFNMDAYAFDDLLDTPNCEDIEKELAGKLTEVLATIIASHPNSTYEGHHPRLFKEDARKERENNLEIRGSVEIRFKK